MPVEIKTAQLALRDDVGQPLRAGHLKRYIVAHAEEHQNIQFLKSSVGYKFFAAVLIASAAA
jgi:hypothetical protein